MRIHFIEDLKHLERVIEPRAFVWELYMREYSKLWKMGDEAQRNMIRKELVLIFQRLKELTTAGKILVCGINVLRNAKLCSVEAKYLGCRSGKPWPRTDDLQSTRFQYSVAVLFTKKQTSRYSTSTERLV